LGRLDPSARHSRIAHVLEITGLTGREKQRVRTYSKGMQQRLGLASALLTDPDLLFLDEPTSALDPLGRKEVREIILEQKWKRKTVFLNSHLLSEVEMNCDRVAIINKGRIIEEGPIDYLTGKTVEVEVEIGGRTPDLDAALEEACFSISWAGEKGKALLRKALLSDKEDRARLAEVVIKNGGRLYELVGRQNSRVNVRTGRDIHQPDYSAGPFLL